MKANFHTHSTWCDGKARPEEMILGAIARGFDTLGFSSHAMRPADPFDWTLSASTLPAYAAEIRALAAKYADRVRILLGVEADYVPGACFPDRAVYASIAPDYVIGSVHVVVAPDGSWVEVDHTPELLEEGIAAHFGGSAEAFVRAYFAAQREMAETCGFDVIGHPDLCRKFNGRLAYFDENAAWYREELERTADVFAASGKIVEVNTGAIARGWMDDAYPSGSFRELLRERGVRFLLGSDAHTVEGLDSAFDRFAAAESYATAPVTTWSSHAVPVGRGLIGGREA